MTPVTTPDFIAKYSDLPVSELAFYIPEKLYIQDEIVINDGRYVGRYSNKTLEEQREEYPLMVIISYDEVVELINNAAKTAVSEITAERFNDMLECMWPLGWHNGVGSESFKFAEMYTGKITSIFAYFTDEATQKRRYFTFRDLVTIGHSEIISRCREFADNEAKA